MSKFHFTLFLWITTMAGILFGIQNAAVSAESGWQLRTRVVLSMFQFCRTNRLGSAFQSRLKAPAGRCRHGRMKMLAQELPRTTAAFLKSWIWAHRTKKSRRPRLARAAMRWVSAHC